MRIVIRRHNRKGERPASRFILIGRLGVTVWRRGAVSFQWNGHFLQIVFGDWWRAT